MNRREVLMSMILVGSSGCASLNKSATTQPVQTEDEKAYEIAAQILRNSKLAADIVIASGILNPSMVKTIQETEVVADQALAAWQKNLNTDSSAELEATFFQILPTIVSLISRGKTNRALLMRKHL